MVFNAIFNNISVISWQSVLLVGKTEVHFAMSGIPTLNFSDDKTLIAHVVVNPTTKNSRPQRPPHIYLITFASDLQ